jgi:uncharacterized protein
MKILESIKNVKTPGFVTSAVIVALGLVALGGAIGHGIYQSRTQRTVTVKGLAEQDAVADLAIWNINISRVGSDLTNLQKDVDKDIEKIKVFLTNAGFNDSEIQNGRIQVRDNFAGYSPIELKAVENVSKRNIGRYVIETGVLVRSTNVVLVDTISRRLGELVRQGITIKEDYSGPAYIFNGLNDIKIEMIEKATKNAKMAGQQFAHDSGAELGKIQSANQGVFSVEARDPITTWADEKQSINKKVRVVSTVTFYLK